MTWHVSFVLGCCGSPRVFTLVACLCSIMHTSPSSFFSPSCCHQQQHPHSFPHTHLSISRFNPQPPSPTLVYRLTPTQHHRPSHFSYPGSGSSRRLCTCVFARDACAPWQRLRLVLQEQRRAVYIVRRCCRRSQG